RRRYLNARHTLRALLALGAVPIVNENDTVAVEELKFGDNDDLPALPASLVEADLLVILSDVAGLYETDPRSDPASRLVTVGRAQDPHATRAAGPARSAVGTGGMASKVAAAAKAAAAGIPTIIAHGARRGVLSAVFDPAVEVGTLLLADGDPLARRKHWIPHALPPPARAPLPPRGGPRRGAAPRRRGRARAGTGRAQPAALGRARDRGRVRRGRLRTVSRTGRCRGRARARELCSDRARAHQGRAHARRAEAARLQGQRRGDPPRRPRRGAGPRVDGRRWRPRGPCATVAPMQAPLSSEAEQAVETFSRAARAAAKALSGASTAAKDRALRDAAAGLRRA